MNKPHSFSYFGLTIGMLLVMLQSNIFQQFRDVFYKRTVSLYLQNWQLKALTLTNLLILWTEYNHSSGYGHLPFIWEIGSMNSYCIFSFRTDLLTIKMGSCLGILYWCAYCLKFMLWYTGAVWDSIFYFKNFKFSHRILLITKSYIRTVVD